MVFFSRPKFEGRPIPVWKNASNKETYSFLDVMSDPDLWQICGYWSRETKQNQLPSIYISKLSDEKPESFLDIMADPGVWQILGCWSRETNSKRNQLKQPIKCKCVPTDFCSTPRSKASDETKSFLDVKSDPGVWQIFGYWSRETNSKQNQVRSIPRSNASDIVHLEAEKDVTSTR
jgi:hypothetical protein